MDTLVSRTVAYSLSTIYVVPLIDFHPLRNQKAPFAHHALDRPGAIGADEQEWASLPARQQ